MSTAGDPPDRDREGPQDPKSPDDKPDGLDVDARFAAIVANWGDEPPTAWPTPEEAAEARRHYEDEQDSAPSPGRMRGSEWGTDWEFAGEDPLPGGPGVRDLGPLDEYDPDELPDELRSSGPRDYSPTDEPERGYEPPEPPPLPKGDLVGRLAWAAVIGGPLFLLMSVLAWRPPQLFILIALAAFAGGFVTLVARMPKHRDDDGDDGAVV
jgi:hypothetical protein